MIKILGFQSGGPLDFLNTRSIVRNDLDRIDQFDDFDPRRHYQLTVNAGEMTKIEREAQAQTVEDIELDV